MRDVYYQNMESPKSIPAPYWRRRRRRCTAVYAVLLLLVVGGFVVLFVTLAVRHKIPMLRHPQQQGNRTAAAATSTEESPTTTVVQSLPPAVSPTTTTTPNSSETNGTILPSSLPYPSLRPSSPPSAIAPTTLTIPPTTTITTIPVSWPLSSSSPMYTTTTPFTTSTTQPPTTIPPTAVTPTTTTPPTTTPTIPATTVATTGAPISTLPPPLLPTTTSPPSPLLIPSITTSPTTTIPSPMITFTSMPTITTTTTTMSETPTLPRFITTTAPTAVPSPPTPMPMSIPYNTTSFRLKMHWQTGYYWQEETFERKWCLECVECNTWDYYSDNYTCYGTAICKIGHQLWLRQCDNSTDASRGGDEFMIHPVAGGIFHQIRVLVPTTPPTTTSTPTPYNINDTTAMDMNNGVQQLMPTTNYYYTLCIQRVQQRYITIQQCNDSIAEQLWFPVSYYGPFAMLPIDRTDVCVSSQHHPKEYEPVSMQTLESAKTTRYWEMYDMHEF